MGTTNEWVSGRTILTTEEWNNFQASGTPISFKIKAESNEGIWVPEPDNSTPASFFTTEFKKVYKHNTNMTSEELNTCVSYLTNKFDAENNPLPEGETLETFCDGTGTLDEITFQECLDNNLFQQDMLNYFVENNIVTLETQIIKNAPVTTIGERAFEYKGLTSVSIPDSVTKIGRSAFGHNNIAQIVVPDTSYDENESTICIMEKTFADEGVEVKNKSNTKSCTIASSLIAG